MNNLWTNLWVNDQRVRSGVSNSQYFFNETPKVFPDLFQIFVIFTGCASIRRFAASFAGLLVLSTCFWWGSTGTAGAMDLPSGVEAELQEVLVETIGTENWLRFRFIAPGLDRSLPGSPEFAILEQDFPHLCTTLAVPYIETHKIKADRIVISIADRDMEFGVTDPEATQYFEQFRLEDGNCVWEAF